MIPFYGTVMVTRWISKYCVRCCGSRTMPPFPPAISGGEFYCMGIVFEAVSKYYYC